MFMRAAAGFVYEGKIVKFNSTVFHDTVLRKLPKPPANSLEEIYFQYSFKSDSNTDLFL